MKDSFSFGEIRRKLTIPPGWAAVGVAGLSEPEQREVAIRSFGGSAECQPPEDICHCCGQLIRRGP